jgi:hypothetical protein
VATSRIGGGFWFIKPIDFSPYSTFRDVSV